MSLLASCVESAPGISYYAPAGSGGGGGSITSSVSTLISPTVLSTVGGTSILNYTGATTSIFSENNNGIFTMAAQPPVGGQQPFIAYNSAINATTIGDGVANLAGGIVLTRQELLVTDPRGPGNSLALTPLTATSSIITQSCATGGSIVIGSSAAQLSTLRVYDAGAATGAVEVGGNGGVPLKIKGGSVASPGSVIVPDTVSGGKLSIGSSAALPRQIEVSDASGVYFGSTLPPIWNSGTAITAVAGGTYGAGTVTIPISSLPNGLYLGLVSPFGAGTTDANTLPCAFSFNFYMKGGLCIAGGVSNNTAGNVFTQPASGLGSIQLVNNSSANIYISVILSKVTGPLPGF